MDIVILSDTHGNRASIVKVKHAHPNAAAYIHCGDSELAYDDPVIINMERVKGNCDLDNRFLDELVVELAGKRIYITHGHLFQVKSTLMSLSYRAEELQADIVCFGHSHLLGAELIEDRLFLNPGSLKQPRGRKEKSYLVLSIFEHQYQIKCYDDNNVLIENFKFNV